MKKGPVTSDIIIIIIYHYNYTKKGRPSLFLKCYLLIMYDLSVFLSTIFIKYIFNYNCNDEFRILGCAVKYVQNERNLSVLKNFSQETELHTEKLLACGIKWMGH
jgi:hypothetical protein